MSTWRGIAFCIFYVLLGSAIDAAIGLIIPHASWAPTVAGICNGFVVAGVLLREEARRER